MKKNGVKEKSSKKLKKKWGLQKLKRTSFIICDDKQKKNQTNKQTKPINQTNQNKQHLEARATGIISLIASFLLPIFLMETNKQTKKQTKTNKQTTFGSPSNWHNFINCILFASSFQSF